MKKKIAIILTLILAAGTFTACTAEEKVNNSSLSPTASTTVGVSVYTESSATATTEKATETTTPKKPQFQKKQSFRKRIPKPKKKPTVGKIRRLLRQRIEPSKIICYSEPFPEMQGDIIYVDYELSGWKYLNKESLDLPLHNKKGIIVNKTMLQPENFNKMYSLKGSGSAYGGKWKPKKTEDERFLGKPGEIKETFDKNGERRLTKIGDDGRATKERHFSFHNRPDKHTNPHDHMINWDPNRGNPLPQRPINYPDVVPEFKYYREVNTQMKVNKNIVKNEEDQFKTISEFKWCVDCGGEVEFQWKGKSYSITHPDGRINIGEGYYIKDGKNYNVLSNEPCIDIEGMWGDTADDILEYIVGGDRLRDVITQVEVVVRTI